MADKPTTVIVASDTHINSRVAVCPPTVNLDEGGSFRASRVQRALWECWLDFWGAMKQVKGRKVVVLNGDLGELDTKRRSYQLITPNKATIIEMALNVLEPAFSIADEVLIVRGTAAHSGKSAWLEEAIAKDLDNTLTNPDSASWWHFRGQISGVKFDITHHARMGGLPHTEKHAALRVIEANLPHYYRDMKAEPPDIFIRSHNHRRSDSGRNYEQLCFFTPAWTMATEFVYRIGQENRVADIGADVLTCKDGEYTWVDHRYHPQKMGRQVWSIKI